MSSKNRLNSFYQGLKSLIAFESGTDTNQEDIKRIVGLFRDALNNGDVIAPFFLHYAANKYPRFIDKKLLPNLSTVPSHKSQAKIWLKSYKQYLKLIPEVEELFKSQVKIARFKKQEKLMRKAYEARKRKLLDTIGKLIGSRCSIDGLFAAMLLQRIEILSSAPLASNISVAYESSAFFPNTLAIVEYFNYLLKNKQLNLHDERHKKLINELKLLGDNHGDISSLVTHYQKEENFRFYSQWLSQSAIHGDMHRAFELMLYYAEGATKWRAPLSKNAELREAILWCDWIFKTAEKDVLDQIIQLIISATNNYQEFIGNNQNKAILLTYMLTKIGDFIDNLTQEGLHLENASRCLHLLPTIENFTNIIKIVWQQHNESLPKPLSTMPKVINELARMLEKSSQYTLAEKYYRKALKFCPSNTMNLFNLANILDLQSKNFDEQIKLYTQAAHQGCKDSLMRLFGIFVFEDKANVEDLENLDNLLNQFNSSMPLPQPKILLLTLIRLTIHQKQNKNDTPFLTWNFNKTESGYSYQPRFNFDAKIDSGADSDLNNQIEYVCASMDVTDDRLSVSKTKIMGDKTTNNESAPTQYLHQTSTSSQNDFFKPKPEENTETRLTSQQKRALNTLATLNEKPRKKLSVKDFIKAQQAYNHLMGDSGAITISHKGRTSGSRAKLGGINFHLNHGRDRTIVGAQKNIQKAIENLSEKISSNPKFQ